MRRERNNQATLYIGNLDEQVSQQLLYELFLQTSPIIAVHLPKDRILKTHQGYGFVEFRSIQDLEYSEKVMQGVKLFNRPIKLNKVTSTRQDSNNNANNNNNNNSTVELGSTLFINNLDNDVDINLLSSIFKQFGPFHKQPLIIQKDDTKSHAFIYYKHFKDSDEALTKMQNQFILTKRIHLEYSFKSNGKTKHGDQVERLLQSQAEKHNYII